MKKNKLKRNHCKTPTIYQMEATECGAASLAMIMASFGKYVPLEQMRVETGVSRDGCNAKNIMKAGKKFGFEVHGYRKDIPGLLELKPPCIIHWNFNHFVVWEGIKNGSAYINDPAMGRRKLTMDDIDDCFTGVVLTFEPKEAFSKSKKEKTLIHFIKRRLQGQYSALMGLVALGLCLVVPGLVIPVFSQIFIDDILLGGNSDWMFALIVAMIGTVVFQGIFTAYRSILLQRLEYKLSLISAYNFLSHMFRLPISFFDQRYAGDLSQRVSNNNRVSSFLAGELAETVLNIMVAMFYLILLMMYSPILTLIGVCGVAIDLGFMTYCSKKLSDNTMKQQQDSGKLMGALFAGMTIFDTLKASGAENEYVARLTGFAAKTAEIEQKNTKKMKILQAIPEAIDDIVNVVIIMIGGYFVIKGEMTSGMLVAFTSLMSSFMSPVGALAGFVQQKETLKADMSRVEDIEKYGSDIKFRTDVDYLDMEFKLTGEVELEGVAFGYGILDAPLIENFNFKLESGHAIALVGASGSGKSTVAKVISGLYSPWKGNVYFDGAKMENIPPEILTGSISTVSQDITLFSGTIRDNITLWNKGIMERDIIRAAKDACIHDVITKMPGAYDGKLTEGGSNLSGGQRQRLEIARALCTNPTIMIMDEATSALDPIVEKQIIDNIKRRGCTCIIVAHRLSAIRDCDEIIVMKQGKIVQRGTHDELKDVEGHYQKLISTM